MLTSTHGEPPTVSEQCAAVEQLTARQEATGLLVLKKFLNFDRNISSHGFLEASKVAEELLRRLFRFRRLPFCYKNESARIDR